MRNLTHEDEKFLVEKIVDMFEKFDNARQKQIKMIDNIKNAIYNEGLPTSQKSWQSRVELPDVYELAQTLKSHICENVFSKGISSASPASRYTVSTALRNSWFSCHSALMASMSARRNSSFISVVVTHAPLAPSSRSTVSRFVFTLH